MGGFSSTIDVAENFKVVFRRSPGLQGKAKYLGTRYLEDHPSKWFVTLMYKPWKGRLHLEGVANLLSGLTNHVNNHLLTGMILQVASVKLKVTASLRLKVMMVWNMRCPFSFGEKVAYFQGVFSCLVLGSVLEVSQDGGCQIGFSYKKKFSQEILGPKSTQILVEILT